MGARFGVETLAGTVLKSYSTVGSDHPSRIRNPKAPSCRSIVIEARFRVGRSKAQAVRAALQERNAIEREPSLRRWPRDGLVRPWEGA